MTTDQREYDAIVIGAGHNGLVTAYYLARDGLSVLVLERIERIGGAIGTEELYPGFHVPYCAYICHMLHGRIIDELELRRHGFDLYPVDPWSFHPFPDGTHLLGWQDTRRFAREIRKLSEPDADALLDWTLFWDRACGIVRRYFLSDPPTFAEVAADLRGTADEEVWETLLTVSMRELVEQHFEDPRVRAYFINAQDAGDPSAPGSALSVAYIRSGVLGRSEDRGIPKGGMGRVSEAMAAAARARGAEIRTGVTVAQIVVDRGHAVGVRLGDGTELRAPVIVSNADPKRTYLGLVPAGTLDEGFVRRVRSLRTRANCVKALVALREFPDFSRWLGPGFDPRLAAYTKICPSVEWFQASWDAAKEGQLSSGPIMYIQFPSAHDPTLAPRGMHVMSSWSLYYPAHPKDGPWDTRKKKDVAELHLEILGQYAPNIRSAVLDITVETPLDIENRIGMTDGNIRHLDVVPAQMFARRMAYRSPVPGLYLCGAGTHPGGELTGAPGHNCARAILRDLEATAPR
jgi:phytoene dehydrogenase-like protein